jgi:2-keto-4-pentenoate hydratase/2-oxohepta-3-ene-1,7-dioic acid hydratase in catechol pathway
MFVNTLLSALVKGILRFDLFYHCSTKHLMAPIFLQRGDVVECRIESIGTIRNKVV